MRRHRDTDGDSSVPSITSARLPLREDVGRRTRRYLVSMAIRTVCVVAAVLAEGPWRWVFLVGAVFLPYIAVVLANAGRERVRTPTPYLEARAIGAGPAASPPGATASGSRPDDAGTGTTDDAAPDRREVDGRAA